MPDVDARFAKLAEERIAAHPLRYYLWLPLGRVADMWLRPRVENLNIDLDWWVYAHHHDETRFSWAYAGLNAFYLLLAAAGLCLRPRFWRTMVAYMLLRSALLTTDRGSRDALHAGVLSDAVCAGGRGTLGGFWEKRGTLEESCPVTIARVGPWSPRSQNRDPSAGSGQARGHPDVLVEEDEKAVTGLRTGCWRRS